MQRIRSLTRGLAALSTAVMLALVSACATTVDPDDADLLDEVVDVGVVTSELVANELVWEEPAHATKSMKSYGHNSWSAHQSGASDIQNAYRVLVNNTYGIKYGQITVSSDVSGWSKASCTANQLQLSARAWVSQNDRWVEVYKADVAPQWLVFSGEFPKEFCSLSTSFPFVSNAAHLRVVAQAKRLPVSLNPRTRLSFIAMNTSISGSGYREPPPPTLSISEVTRTGDANLLQLKMDYDGLGTRIGFGIKGTYKYCAESACTLNSAEYCKGKFCPPGIAPSGSHIYPLPQPKLCTFSKSAAPTMFIAPEINFAWPKPPMAPDSSDCPPCLNDGRCGDLLVEATASSPDEFWEYDQQHLQVWGTVGL